MPQYNVRSEKSTDTRSAANKMAPSQLQIATSALQRLVKEEASYYKELESQKKRIAELEKTDPSSDENLEFKIKQEVSPY